MLHIAGIDFKDTRVAFKDWPALKPTMPLGSMPILKIDGADHCQSMALARYAAKKAGYYPEDPLEALIVDEVMDTCNEIMSKAPRDPDADVMKKMRQDWQVGQLTQYANFIENKIQASGGKSVVKTPSVADIAVSAFVDAISSGTWDYIDADFFNQFPGMM
jgi:glutathione S-transferase